MSPDLINGIFESAGAAAILDHCWQLWKDKSVRGVSWKAVTFFTLWGYWNLFYYPHLDQWWSFWGGVFIVASNMLWLCMMLYYIRAESTTDARVTEDGVRYSRKAELARRVRAYVEVNRR